MNSSAPPVAPASTSPSPRRRGAAILALAALLGALITALFVVLNGTPERIAGFLACVTMAVVGSWYLLARRGGGRVAGALVAAAGLLGFALLALTADHTLILLLVVVALGSVSAAAARYALGRDPGTLQASARRPSVPRPARPVLLMNPKSGGGKVERFGLVDECRRRRVEAVVMGPGDDLVEMAEKAIGEGADAIGMAGGDGSQALVAAVASRHDVPYICIPAGTRNHFALDLGLDRDDIAANLDAFIDGVERTIDLASVNGRIFVNNASLGLYSRIVQSPEYRDAKLQTAAGMLPEMLGPEATGFDLRYIGPRKEPHSSAHLLLVSNNPYQIDHIGGMGTRAALDTGSLGVVAASIAGPAEAVEFVALEAAGRIRSFPGWVEWSTPRFEIESSGPVEIAIDGESMVLDPPLMFESLPGRLRMRIPAQARGFAPAASAVALDRSLVAALVRTAIGR